ncbi:hypothetical protein M1247_16105 [Mycobacterium sp. 21AC1]|uniref:hypothetical protein n=1 Tax=[Mycobacterium] appelbergii TaxID=2939269 RepID=UPI0029390676|nr:hypothetical protein [Mycobacterium sp. 21AC1]MDV3126446.1 hypothetical protein [Mycobacterium sp. 21AC1]
MTEQHGVTLSVSTAKFALAGLAIAGTVLAAAVPAAADPAVPGPAPAVPDPVAAAPGQPVLPPDAAGPPPPPPPGAPPSVPEIANPVYGSGQFGSGPLGSLRDIWHQAQNPYDLQGPTGQPTAPPPGAGVSPPLPPGYVSMNAPGSETPSKITDPGGAPAAGAPALPPGYYPLQGPPPPGYEFNSPNGAPAPPAPPAPPAGPTP